MEHVSVLVSGLSGGKANAEGPAWLCGATLPVPLSRLQKHWLPPLPPKHFSQSP
jgi:hypothetical protein